MPRPICNRDAHPRKERRVIENRGDNTAPQRAGRRPEQTVAQLPLTHRPISRRLRLSQCQLVVSVKFFKFAGYGLLLDLPLIPYPALPQPPGDRVKGRSRVAASLDTVEDGEIIAWKSSGGFQ